MVKFLNPLLEVVRIFSVGIRFNPTACAFIKFFLRPLTKDAAKNLTSARLAGLNFSSRQRISGPLLGIAAAVLLASCAAEDQSVVYNPSAQILPQHIQKIAVDPIVNKTQQFGLEDKLTLKVNSRFLSDGTYKMVSNEEADGVVHGEINRYIHIPVAYDSNLIATQYKLDVIVRLTFIDRHANAVLWEEPNLMGSIVYPVSNQPGGMTEEQAREIVWDQISKDILKRTIEGFGAVTGESRRKISPVVPDQSNNQ